MPKSGAFSGDALWMCGLGCNLKLSWRIAAAGKARWDYKQRGWRMVEVLWGEGSVAAVLQKGSAVKLPNESFLNA